MTAPRPARRADLAPGLQAVLSRYRPDERQDRHAHDVHELTLVLAGDLGETLGGQAYDCRAGWAAFKPAGAVHADTWGRRGALTFSLKVSPEALARDEPAPGWRRLQGPMPTQLLRACFASGVDADDLAADLLAALASPSAAAIVELPRWLREAHERICAEPARAAVAAVAAASGVSRGHFYTAFQQAYGVAPSVFRRQAMTAEALRLALDARESLAHAAAEAGFADQSHMSRAVKADTGWPLAELRRDLKPDIGSRRSPGV